MGLVTVTVCTAEFVNLAGREAAALGMAELPLVVIPHPMADKSPDQVADIAARVADNVALALGGKALGVIPYPDGVNGGGAGIPANRG